MEHSIINLLAGCGLITLFFIGLIVHYALFPEQEEPCEKSSPS
jgi:hypothetical protein